MRTKMKRYAVECLGGLSRTLKPTFLTKIGVGLLLTFTSLAFSVSAQAAPVTYNFTANNTTHLFGEVAPFSLFGTFTYDYETGFSTSDFWVQAPNASNGNYTSNGTLNLGNSTTIRGFDATSNNIILTFAQSFPTTAGVVAILSQVNFDNGFSVDNSPVGGACIVGTCPDGNAPLDLAAASAPEPASFALFGGGIVGLGLLRRRRPRA
jgi:hypothetical protein